MLTVAVVGFNTPRAKNNPDVYLFNVPSELNQPLLSQNELQSWDAQNFRTSVFYPLHNFDSLRDYQLNHLYAGYNSPFVCYKFPPCEFTASG